MMQATEATYEKVDAVVVGGGPAGSTAATDLARQGFRVVLLERGGRIKPCGISHGFRRVYPAGIGAIGVPAQTRHTAVDHDPAGPVFRVSKGVAAKGVSALSFEK